jgi:hypothetical protein
VWQASEPVSVNSCKAASHTMMCLHYYSNYVTLSRIADEDEEYSLDQIQEFASVEQRWKDYLADYVTSGTS